jgi:YegS/Rv2252/BmrU family lipid kinase
MEIAGTPLTLLVNPSSAGGKTLRLLPRIEAALDTRRAVFRVEKTKDLEHGVELALRAVELGEIPIVVSGDGLLGAVGGAMAGSDVPLGLIPGGRGNDLARALGIPEEPEAAVDVVLDGESRRIDVGEANGKRFLGIVSVGFDSECNRLANETHLLRGNLVYVYSMIRTLIGWRVARFSIAIGDERKRISGYFVAVANNSVYGGGMYIAPDASLDDGEFDVVSIADVGKLRFLSGLRDVLKGTHLDKEEVSVFRTPRLELDASRPFPVYADGDHLTDLPVSLRILPRCLSILVPARSGGDPGGV